MKICAVEECRESVKARGWCATHYTRWFRHGDPIARKNIKQDATCSVEACERPPTSLNLCPAHLRRKYVHGDVKADTPLLSPERPTRVVTDQGYVRIKLLGHPRGGKHGWPFEHIVIMERSLGRSLYPGETVHHANGVRGDNRPENLELWVTSQPRGQRPADLVAWAREVLERYEGTVDVVGGSPI